MDLYAPFLERDENGIRAAIREYRRSHTSQELFESVARFAVLAYAPSQHAKHAMICCLSAWEVRDKLGDRFDDLLAECAIYAAASRQPWSEPPITDPPPLDAKQRGDIDELRESVAAQNRLRGERWLAKRYRDPDFARDYFTVASDDFEDLGHKLIIAVTAWKLARIFGEQGSYPTLRTGIWEMTAYRGERYAEKGGSIDRQTLIQNMVANRGDIVSAHALFLYDAAEQTGDADVMRRVRDYLGSTGTPAGTDKSVRATSLRFQPYRLARDYGAFLKAFARGDDRVIAAAKYNLDHAPSFDEFTFA